MWTPSSAWPLALVRLAKASTALVTTDHSPLLNAEQLFVENLSQTAFIVGAHLNCMSNIVQVLGAVLQSV